MADSHLDPLIDALQSGSEGAPVSAAALAARLPMFPASAIEEALKMLSLTGVLAKETLPDGTIGYRYAHPERYRMVNSTDVKLPGPDFGRR